MLTGCGLLRGGLWQSEPCVKNGAVGSVWSCGFSAVVAAWFRFRVWWLKLKGAAVVNRDPARSGYGFRQPKECRPPSACNMRQAVLAFKSSGVVPRRETPKKARVMTFQSGHPSASASLDPRAAFARPISGDASRSRVDEIGPSEIYVSKVGGVASKERRFAAYKDKNTAALILSKQGDRLETLARRVSHCRYVAFDPVVALERSEKGARFSGLKRCDSVWCCPLCSARISAGRRDELNAALSAARAQGLAVVMLTLTARHSRKMNLAAWLDAFKKAKKAMRQHWGWKAFKPAFVGSVTATEVTHGANGFHPHFHEILFIDLPSDQALLAVEKLRSVWLASLSGVGLSGEKAAFDVRPASAAGDYVAKFGAAEELTLTQSKAGRGETSRTPWQLLSDAGDAANADAATDVAIWAEYARAFMGRRQLVWSHKLKARFGVDDVADDEIPDTEAAPEPQVLRAWLGSSESWRAARRRSVALLNAAESGGCLDAAEFGETDASRWSSRPSGDVLEPI